MKVSEVMSRQIDSISPKASVEKAALLIFGHNINGIPVIQKRKIVGFITERDILASFFPTFEEYVEDFAHTSNFEEMEKKTSAILSLPVEKIMSRTITKVSPDTPLLKAHSLMMVKEIGRLPVVDDEGNLVGILSKGDVFRSIIGDKLLFTENEDYNDFLSKTYYATVNWNSRIKYEIPDLIKLFQKHNVKKILDVGCGTGDHSVEFAKRGCTVTGIDRSKPMILEANIRKESLKKDLAKNVTFINGNTENIIPLLKETFDCAIFMGNTVSHNPHNYKKLIKTVVNQLSENGVVVFQITNFEKVLKVKNRLLNFNFVKSENDINKEYAFLEFYDNPIEHDKTLLKTFAILSSDKKRWKWTGIRNSIMAHIGQLQFAKELSSLGLKNTKFYGGSFDGKTWDYLFRKPYKPLESDWMNIVATRK